MAHNLGVANDFNLFILGNHTQNNVDCEGRVAVKGNASYDNYTVGSSLEMSQIRDDLIIGGNVNISGGTNAKGNTVISNTSSIIKYTMTNNNNIPDQPLRGEPVNFSEEDEYLKSLSAELSLLENSGEIKIQYGGLTLTGTSETLNIFHFNGMNIESSGLSLSQLNQINIIIPEGSTVIINISGATLRIWKPANISKWSACNW